MNKILSVTLAISLMAILLVGCNAENGKIGNGINGTVTDNQSAVSFHTRCFICYQQQR